MRICFFLSAFDCHDSKIYFSAVCSCTTWGQKSITVFSEVSEWLLLGVNTALVMIFKFSLLCVSLDGAHQPAGTPNPSQCVKND